MADSLQLAALGGVHRLGWFWSTLVSEHPALPAVLGCSLSALQLADVAALIQSPVACLQTLWRSQLVRESLEWLCCCCCCCSTLRPLQLQYLQPSRAALQKR